MKHVIRLLIVVLSLTVCFSSCKKKVKKIVVKKEKVVKKDTVKPIPVVKPIVKSIPNKYFLIAGVFEYKKYSDKFYEKLSDLGYEPRVFLSEDGFYKISYKGFSDRSEAFKMLEEERSKEETKDVWLYILPKE